VEELFRDRTAPVTLDLKSGAAWGKNYRR